MRYPRPIKPDWVRKEIVRLKALMPDAGCRSIALVFNRRYAAHGHIHQRMTVGKTFVADVIKRHQYEITVLRRSIKHHVPPSMANNTVWAIDMTGKTDTTGQTHMILGLIDHGSRALLTLAALPNKTSWMLLGHLCLAIAKYGKPRALRSDNEAAFTSRLMRAALTCFGIRQQLTTPGCPWQNGRMERLFLTLKQKLNHVEVSSRDALNIALGQFCFYYNAVRPHQHLQGRTPAEAWAGLQSCKVAVTQAHWFEAWGGLLCGFYLRR
jgi:transposase InsO family protein